MSISIKINNMDNYKSIFIPHNTPFYNHITNNCVYFGNATEKGSTPLLPLLVYDVASVKCIYECNAVITKKSDELYSLCFSISRICDVLQGFILTNVLSSDIVSMKLYISKDVLVEYDNKCTETYISGNKKDLLNMLNNLFQYDIIIELKGTSMKLLEGHDSYQPKLEMIGYHLGSDERALLMNNKYHIYQSLDEITTNIKTINRK